MDSADVVSALEAKQRELREELARIQVAIGAIKGVLAGQVSKKAEKGSIGDRAVRYIREVGGTQTTKAVADAIKEKYNNVFSALDRRDDVIKEGKGAWRLKE